MAEVAAMESALVSFVAPPDTKPNIALRHAKHQCLSLRRFVGLKPCHVTRMVII